MIPAPINRVNRLLRANAVAAPYLIEDVSTQLIFLIAGNTCEMDYSLIAGKQKTDWCQDNPAKLTVSARHSFFLSFGKQTHDQYYLLKPLPPNAALDSSLSAACCQTIFSSKFSACSNRCCCTFEGFWIQQLQQEVVVQHGTQTTCTDLFPLSMWSWLVSMLLSRTIISVPVPCLWLKQLKHFVAFLSLSNSLPSQ